MTARPPLRSAVYEGTLTHRRHEVRPHGFRYRLAMPLLDLDELDAVCALHPLWSATSPNGAWVRRHDFLRDGHAPGRPTGTRPTASWADSVRDLVEDQLGHRPGGPVDLLANPRTFGWLANPLTTYYCHEEDGRAGPVVLEVTNTPWHERHHYVVAVPGEHLLPKAMHVSPFFAMDHTYRLRVGTPGERLDLRLDNLTDAGLAFEAILAMRRLPMTRASLGRILWRYPLQPQRVSAGIYGHAVALRVKGVSFHPHPDRRSAGKETPTG